MRPGESVADRFVVEHLAGRGGMGEVYRAVDQSTREPVAIKVLLGNDLGDVGRFAREAQLLSKLAHPGIVRHIAHGALAEGHPYLVMEWLEGEDLAGRLARGSMPATEAISLMIAVSEALGALHDRGIVHRDLKPSNIFLPSGRTENAKLLDFGISTSATISRMTQTGMILGTASYMAPEQADGTRTVDARADIFSLGCVFYECLTGMRAFGGAHVIAILTKVIFGDPPHLREKRPGLPESLYTLVDRMLSKAPESRPANAHEVARVLRALGDFDVSPDAPTLQTVRPPALTGGEQRAAAIIFLGPVMDEERRLDEQLAMEAANFGGRLEKLFDGSAVVLLWDASVATDLGVQAAFCALALKRIAPSRRISLALGWNETTGRIPLGPAIDRAAKLFGESSAETVRDDIALDDAAVGLLDARFEVAKTGGYFVLRGERDITDVRTLLGKPTPFVGRERDLRRIEDFFEACVTDSRATVALVTASAGMGKSRLGREIVHRLRKRSEEPFVWVARGQWLGAGSALSLLSELIQSACEIRGGDTLEVRREKIIHTVEKHIQAKHREDVAAFLGEAIGARFPEEGHSRLAAARADAQLMGDRIRESFVDFVKAVCDEKPVFMLIEDLHWGDSATVKILDSVLREANDKSIFVLALARPEVEDVFPKLWHERNLETIRLNQLTKKAGEQLVRYVLGARVAPELVERIVQLADGNAFYLEELIRHAAEGKGHELPETVVAMVQSRLSGLDDVSRRLLRAASIFGETFWDDGVAALLGGTTDATAIVNQWRVLTEGEFISKRKETRFAGVEEYAFRHALLREGAYAMLTDADRKLGHRLAGEWLERHNEHDPVVLAEHFEKGGEGEKAAAYYLRAADVACHGGDSETALQRVEQGLAAGPAQDARIKLLGIFCEAMAWALQNVELGHQRANDVLEHAAPGSIPWAQAAFMKVVACAFWGNFAELVATVPRLLEAPVPQESVATMELAICSSAYLLDIAGLTQLATLAVERGKQIAAEIGSSGSVALSRYLCVRMTYAEEDPWEATKHAMHAYSGGRARLDMTARLTWGFAHLCLGSYADAQSVWSDVLLSDLDLGYVSSFRPFMLAWTNADRGMLEEARTIAERLLESGRTLQRPLDQAHGHWVLAEVLRRMGDLERSDQEVQAALAMAIPLDKPGVLATLAALRLAQNRPGEAMAAAEEGMQKYEEMRACSLFMRGGFLRVVHVECLHAAGRGEEAKSAITKAKEWLLAIVDKIGEEKYKTTFLENVPENRRILELAR